MIPQAFPQFQREKRTRFCAASSTRPAVSAPSVPNRGYPRRIEYVLGPYAACLRAKRTRFCAGTVAERTYFCVDEVEAPHAPEAYLFLRRTQFCEIQHPGGPQAKAYPFLRNNSPPEICKAYLLLRNFRRWISRCGDDVYVYARVPAEPALTVYRRKRDTHRRPRTRFCATFTDSPSVYLDVYGPSAPPPGRWRTRFCADAVHQPGCGSVPVSAQGPPTMFSWARATAFVPESAWITLPTGRRAALGRQSVPDSAWRARTGRTHFC